MTYTSPTGNQTRQKENLHRFMETNKKQGVVSFNKLKSYVRKKGYKLESGGQSKTASRGYGKKSTMYWGRIKTGNTILADIGIKNIKNPVVVWWAIR